MIKRSLLLSSLLLVAGGLQAQDQAPDLEKAKQTAETVCAACHSADGNSQLPANPKIAGQHEDYLFKQLREFKGWNGNPPVRENAIMGAMVAGLEEADMRGLAKYFAANTLQPEPAKNLGTVELEKVEAMHDIDELQGLIKRHQEATGSKLAAKVLANWHESLSQFVKVMPTDYKRVLEQRTRTEVVDE